MIQTGLATKTGSYIDVGLRSLRWLMSIQSAPQGHFRPIGGKSFGNSRQMPEAFDQQPVEAAAAISACLAAFRAGGDEEWSEGAKRAFAWFTGENDLGIGLIDPDTGSCLDGLHPDRANENKGAESVLSYLLGLQEIRQFQSSLTTDHTAPTSRLARPPGTTFIPQTSVRKFIASIPLRESAELVSAAGPDEGRRPAL